MVPSRHKYSRWAQTSATLSPVSSIVEATATGLGLDNSEVTRTNGTAVTAALTAGDLTVNGVDVGAVAQDAKLQAAAITATSTDVTATASTSVNVGAFTAATGETSGDVYTLTVAGVDIAATSTGAGTITAAAMDTALAAGTVLADLATAGITTSGSFAGGNMTFIDADGDNIVISEAEVGTCGGTSPSVAAGTDTNYGSISSITSSGADLVIAGTDATKARLTTATATASTNTLNVSTVAGAGLLITAVDTAINSVNSARGTLGAVQNRFESVVTSLQTSAESLSAARSRIQDADFAQETANLTKAQILQQAGVAMIAQANSLPQNVLSLLG